VKLGKEGSMNTNSSFFLNGEIPKVWVVFLAAGKGTRMKVEHAKPLIPVRGRPMLGHVLNAVKKFEDKLSITTEKIFIIGHQKEQVKQYILKSQEYTDKETHFVVQDQQLGTGHALQMVNEYVKNNERVTINDQDIVLVCCADTPLLRGEDLVTLVRPLVDFPEKWNASIGVIKVDKPQGYGRVIDRDQKISIVEEKDANESERLVQTVNTGVYAFYAKNFLQSLSKIRPSSTTQEIYLTEVFDHLKGICPVHFKESHHFMGVNDFSQLAIAEKILKQKKIHELQMNGVYFLDPESVYIDESVVVDAGVTIYPQVQLYGTTKISKSSTIYVGSVIKDSLIGENVDVKPYSVIEKSEVMDRAQIGPFAHLGPASIIGKESKIGNFVEIKNSMIEEGVKISHLSYVGDAKIGEQTNIGCGFITCNYDGKQKHETVIGKECFIGSDSQMIAPVTIGDYCYVASGSTINQSMADESFAISRGKQETKVGLAKKFHPKLQEK